MSNLIEFAMHLQKVAGEAKRMEAIGQEVIDNFAKSLEKENPEAVARFKAQASHILSAAKNGGDFTALFKKYSEQAKNGSQGS